MRKSRKSQCRVLALLLFLSLTVQVIQSAAQTVAQTNNTRPSASPNLVVGDSFTKSITGGAPNARIDANVNGTLFTNVGTTDAAGNWSANGSATDPGKWTETWFVGGVLATPALNFFVIQAPPTVQLSNTSRPSISPDLWIGDSFTVTITAGSPASGQTISAVVNGTVFNNVGTTDVNGNWSASGTATDPGTWTEDWFVAGIQATPTLHFTVFPLTCSGLSSPYLGSAQLSGPSQLMPITVQGVASGAVSVEVLVWNETQTIATATSFPATSSGSGNWQTTLQSSQFTALGSYTVSARVHGNDGASRLCPNPAFFAILNENGFPPPLPRTDCSTLAGAWRDVTQGEPTLTWILTQAGSTLSGTTFGQVSPGCPTTTWQVSGSKRPSGPTFDLTASNPNPPGSGFCTAVSTLMETVSMSNLVCNRASGTFTNESGSGPVFWFSAPAIPQGETSQFSNPSNPWDTNGFSTAARFKGVLAALSNGTQFSGRQVRETAASLSDGCNMVTGTTDGVMPVVPGDINGAWYVQTDNTYGDDLMGYDPAIARYYQTYARNCSLSLQQAMQINVDNNMWQTYVTNGVTLSVQPAQVSVTRAGVTAIKNPYPAY